MTTATTDSRELKPAALTRIHSAALEQAGKVSQELRRSARAVRLAHGKAVSRPSFAAAARISARAFGTIRRSREDLFGFLAFFVTPAVLVVAYFSLIASSEYMSEARFAVRDSERIPTDMFAALTGLASFTQIQDSLIVVNYVKSQALVEALEREIGISAIYGRDGIDWFSRFDTGDPVEDLVEYWQWHIKTAIESQSGIVTMQVTAFSPDDTLRIANAVVDLSERLVNGLSARARQDAVAEAEAELKRAEARLTGSRIKLRDLRNQQATLDPLRTAEGIDRLISELRLEKIRLEQELTSAQRGNVSDTAPQIQIMRRRAEVIGEQISSLDKLLTSQDNPHGGTIAGKLTGFDDLELERQIAEKQYTLAAAALESARINAEGQKVYLATFVHPVLPTDYTYPKRVLFSLLGIAGVALLYAAGKALARTARRRPGGTE
ncbi:MAG: hypothetical protein L0Y50_09075 [Beijerinckiaceae bacterium]|nr:hypothetical protein [Beijerinckiaceae bacterium]